MIFANCSVKLLLFSQFHSGVQWTPCTGICFLDNDKLYTQLWAKAENIVTQCHSWFVFWAVATWIEILKRWSLGVFIFGRKKTGNGCGFGHQSKQAWPDTALLAPEKKRKERWSPKPAGIWPVHSPPFPVFGDDLSVALTCSRVAQHCLWDVKMGATPLWGPTKELCRVHTLRRSILCWLRLSKDPDYFKRTEKQAQSLKNKTKTQKHSKTNKNTAYFGRWSSRICVLAWKLE